VLRALLLGVERTLLQLCGGDRCNRKTVGVLRPFAASGGRLSLSATAVILPRLSAALWLPLMWLKRPSAPKRRSISCREYRRPQGALVSDRVSTSHLLKRIRAHRTPGPENPRAEFP
jgi:hypothetical protein